IFFTNVFIMYDEAHDLARVAARHIGVSASSGQVRFALQRLWNPRTEKGVLATLRRGTAVKLVAELFDATDKFFVELEEACEGLARQNAATRRHGSRESRSTDGRTWTELRIRRPDLVRDNVTLPIQRLREAVSELIKSSEDTDTGQELMECNRRLSELREAVVVFLSQSADQHVYWVERTGKTQKNLALNAAPIDVAEYLRHRLFGADTSVVMTSATLGTRVGQASSLSQTKREIAKESETGATPVLRRDALDYFVRKV